MSHLVISHVASDGRLVAEIAAGLRAAGHPVWLAERQDPLAPAGDAAAVLPAIESAPAVIALISPVALSERGFDAQIERVLATGRPWLAILRDISGWEFALRRPAWARALADAGLLTLTPAGVAALLPALLAGLDRLGVRPEPGGAPAQAGPAGVPPAPAAERGLLTPPSLGAPVTLPPPAWLAAPPAPAEPTTPDWLTLPPSPTPPAASTTMAPPPEPALPPPPPPPPAETTSRPAPAPAETAPAATRAAAVPLAAKVLEHRTVFVEGRAPLPAARPRPKARRGWGCIGWTIALLFGIGVLLIVGFIALVVAALISGAGGDAATPVAPPVATSQIGAGEKAPAIAAPSAAAAAVAATGTATRVTTATAVRTRPPATAPPTPAPAGVRTLRDTFSNPDQGLLPRESDDPARYRRGYERGEYVLASLGPGEVRAPLLAPVPGTHGDLAIGVDARLVGDTAGRTLMVVCHDQGVMGGAGYGLLVSPGRGQFAVARWDGGRETRLVDWQTARAVRQGNQTNRLELHCRDGGVQVRINGIQVAQFQDATYRAGTLWLGVTAGGDGTTPTEAHFDSLVVMSWPTSGQASAKAGG